MSSQSKWWNLLQNYSIFLRFCKAVNKGQLISKQNCQAVTNKTIVSRVRFVRFLGKPKAIPQEPKSVFDKQVLDFYKLGDQALSRLSILISIFCLEFDFL